MWKVSFNNPSSKKVQVFNDKVTVVTLTGFMALPEHIFKCIPYNINRWLNTLHNPDVDFKFFIDNGVYITAKGVAKRADGDVDNPTVALRLAEARAKATIYLFVLKFADKFVRHYNKIVTGDEHIYITESTKYSDNSLYAVLDRYNELYQRELSHIQDLILTL